MKDYFRDVVRIGLLPKSKLTHGRIMIKNELIRRLFFFIWKKWLYNTYYKNHDKVVCVTGWRSAIIESRTNRYRVTFCPRWIFWENHE